MAKYTTEQKVEAVRLFTVMSNEGTCYWKDTPIHNIRALCKALNISSQSLYRWAEEFTDIMDEDELTLVENEEDLFEEVMTSSRTEAKEEFFNGRYYAWMGARLNIPYASRNAKETNMLKIGLELIKRSGLVDCDKVKDAMRVN